VGVSVVTPAGMRHDLKLAETVTRGYTVLEPKRNAGGKSLCAGADRSAASRHGKSRCGHGNGARRRTSS